VLVRAAARAGLVVHVEPRWQVAAERLVRAGAPGGSGGRHSWRLRTLFASEALVTPDVVCGESGKLLVQACAHLQ
jgi:hypothetical protein